MCELIEDTDWLVGGDKTNAFHVLCITQFHGLHDKGPF